MDKEKGLLNIKLSFKALPDGSLYKNKAIAFTVDVNWVTTGVHPATNTCRGAI